MKVLVNSVVSPFPVISNALLGKSPTSPPFPPAKLRFEIVSNGRPLLRELITQCVQRLADNKRAFPPKM